MIRLLVAILFLFVVSCSDVASQQPSEEMKREAEFQEVLRKARETSAKNRSIIKAADSQSTQIITKTSEKITVLKEEVKELKQELNEIKPDPSVPPIKYKLLPLADSSENRW